MVAAAARLLRATARRVAPRAMAAVVPRRPAEGTTARPVGEGDTIAVGAEVDAPVAEAVAATPVVVAATEVVGKQCDSTRFAVNEVNDRGGKGVPEGTPFLIW